MRDRDRSARRDRIDDHVVRGRHQQRLQRTRDGHVDREQARIAVLDHLRDHHRADRRGIGDGRARQTAEHGRSDDVDQRHAAAHEADEHLGQIDQAFGHAADRHDGAGQDEERDRQQREIVHAVGGLEHDRLERETDPNGPDDRGKAECIGDGHAHEAKHGEAADEDEGIHARGTPTVVILWRGCWWFRSTVPGTTPGVHIRSITNSTISRPPMGTGR